MKQSSGCFLSKFAPPSSDSPRSFSAPRPSRQLSPSLKGNREANEVAEKRAPTREKFFPFSRFGFSPATGASSVLLSLSFSRSPSPPSFSPFPAFLSPNKQASVNVNRVSCFFDCDSRAEREREREREREKTFFSVSFAPRPSTPSTSLACSLALQPLPLSLFLYLSPRCPLSLLLSHCAPHPFLPTSSSLFSLLSSPQIPPVNVSLVVPQLSLNPKSLNWSKPGVPALGLAAKNGTLPFVDAVGARVVNVTMSFALPSGTNKTSFVTAFGNNVRARSFAAKKSPKVVAVSAGTRKLASASKKAPAAVAHAPSAAAKHAGGRKLSGLPLNASAGFGGGASLTGRKLAGLPLNASALGRRKLSGLPLNASALGRRRLAGLPLNASALGRRRLAGLPLNTSALTGRKALAAAAPAHAHPAAAAAAHAPAHSPAVAPKQPKIEKNKALAAVKPAGIVVAAAASAPSSSSAAALKKTNLPKISSAAAAAVPVHHDAAAAAAAPHVINDAATKKASSSAAAAVAQQEGVLPLPPNALGLLPLNQTHVLLSATIAKLQQLG